MSISLSYLMLIEIHTPIQGVIRILHRRATIFNLTGSKQTLYDHILPKPVFTFRVAKWWFSNLSLSTFTTWHLVFFFKWESPIPFIYLLLVWTHELLHFLVVYNLLLYLLWCSNFLKFGQWKFLQADLCILVGCPPPTFPSFFLLQHFFNL